MRLYDSKQQAVVDFVPLEPEKVGMYVCGPTVQSCPHIGHLRSALVLRPLAPLVHLPRLRRDAHPQRHRHRRQGARRIRRGSNEPWWALAYRIELEFTAGYHALGILPPTYEPRATASIPQMLELIQRLIDAGHAYAAAGDVYFDTLSWPTLRRAHPAEAR